MKYSSRSVLVAVLLWLCVTYCAAFASFYVYCGDPDRYGRPFYGLVGYYFQDQLTDVFC